MDDSEYMTNYRFQKLKSIFYPKCDEDYPEYNKPDIFTDIFTDIFILFCIGIFTYVCSQIRNLIGI